MKNQIKWGNIINFSDLIANLTVSVSTNENTRASCLVTINFQCVFITLPKTRAFVHSKNKSS